MWTINPPWLGRAILGVLGLLIYWFGLRATAKQATQSASLAVSYTMAGIVLCGAALFFVGSVVPAMGEAVLESFGSTVGLLLLAGGKSRYLPRPLLALINFRNLRGGVFM